MPLSPPNADDPAKDASLRDWLAGQALAGLLANPNLGGEASRPRAIAASAYVLADAALAARDGERANPPRETRD